MKANIRIFIGVFLLLTTCARASAVDVNTIYDSNPNHPWNRLNKVLFERTAPDGRYYGLDELDILYWARTTNLLAGASHQQALDVLDDFIHAHDENLIHDPLKKALLQRDLWALFDWAAVPTPFYQAQFPKARRELESRLAIVIRRLELTTNEIASLPDNYSLAEKSNLADLPRGLFITNGNWINISVPNVLGLVPMHDLSFGGRSVFMVLFHDADGRKAGLNYLKQIGVPPLYVSSGDTNSSNGMTFNPSFPQFPTNSQWALVRLMRAIDTDGKIRMTHVVENIQLRTYLGFGRPEVVMETNQNGSVVPVGIPPQRFNELQMTRDAQANLISVAQDQRDFTFVHFMGMGFDAFESNQGKEAYDVKRWQTRVLGTCLQCHGGKGIYSVNSFTRSLSLDFSHDTTQMVESDGNRDEEMGLFSKELRADWGLMQGLWMQNN